MTNQLNIGLFKTISQNSTVKNLEFLLEVLTKEQKIQEIDEALGDSSLYNADREKFTNLSTERANLQAELEAKENEWLELQLLQEELFSAQ